VGGGGRGDENQEGNQEGEGGRVVGKGGCLSAVNILSGLTLPSESAPSVMAVLSPSGLSKCRGGETPSRWAGGERSRMQL
jgi:hypothetical protein